MSSCSACGRAVRKTSRAFVIGKGMGNVCRECAGWGLLVVAPKVAVVKVTKTGGADRAVALARLNGLRRSLVAIGADDRKIEGIDAAVAILKRDD